MYFGPKIDSNKYLNTFIRQIGYKGISEYIQIFLFCFNFLLFLSFSFFLLCRMVAGWEQAGVGTSKVHFLYFCKCNIVFLAKATQSVVLSKLFFKTLGCILSPFLIICSSHMEEKFLFCKPNFLS